MRGAFQGETLLEYGLIALRARWVGLALGGGLLWLAHLWGLQLATSGRLVLVGVGVALYNGALQVLVRRWRRRGQIPSVVQINLLRRLSSSLDMAVFFTTIHLTGGAESPLFPFFLLGFVLLGVAATGPEIFAYGLAAVVVLPGLVLLEARGVLTHHGIGVFSVAGRYQDLQFAAVTIGYWLILFLSGMGLVWLIRVVMVEQEARLEDRRVQLEHHKQFQADVLQHLPIGVLVFGPGGRILLSNPIVSQLLELDLEQNRNLLRLPTVADSGMRVYVERLLDGQPIELVDFPFVPRAGAIKRWLRVIGLPPDDNQRGILLVEDTSAAKERDEREREMQERLSQADKFTSLGQMASGVAHELNNPLTAIVGTAQYLEYVTRQGKLSPDLVEEKAAHIVTHSRRIEQLVKSLLTYSKPGRGAPQPLDVGKMVEELLSFSTYELTRGHVELSTDVAPDTQPFLGSKIELQQLMLNLLTNAHHAVAGRPGHIRLSVRTVARDGERWLRIEIADNGPGIPPDALDRIFEPFFTTKGADEGTGLGLAIVNAIVERYEGAIRVDTTPETGTTFAIDLPYREERPAWQANAGEQTFSPYQ